MKIIYLGSFPPDFLIKKSGGKIDSLYRDYQPFIKGLRENKDVDLIVLTSPDVVNYPKGPLFIKREYNNEEGVLLVSSLNISLLKQLWTIITMTLEAGKIIRSSKEKVAVIIPYMVFRHVFTLRLLRLLHSKKVVQVCVVPDVFFHKKWINREINNVTEKIASKFDCFVLYTKKMADYLKIDSGKYTVIEGFRIVANRKPQNYNIEFKVVYAGLLNLRYGIGRLVDAMNYIDDKDVQLHLFGSGDGVSFIQQRCNLDSRIFYHGRVPNAEATNAIYSASALINPRNSTDGEYVEYSFPSKDIEYMATGIPTLLCKLPGMPHEYLGHFVDIGDATPEQIAAAIVKVKQMDVEERRTIGEKARRFIVERMDCNRQAARIVSLIKANM